ncbi:MAG: 2-succinyl-6-hydroxy-2,4-cyclohexadiene-1-carboxylate synthase [Melioribacter sp.]|nr:2-succinyl-6-hydroxy-2,4-cyclohexadiene-1-carboxylate synthase [Melioribacter sp.]
MKLKVDDIQFNLHINESDFNNEKTPIVFLHGFTGRASDWQFIFNKIPPKFFPIAIDLIGHGETDSPENQDYYSCHAIVNQIDSIINQLNIKKFIIAGYSMGGRAALAYSYRHPQKIKAAILESTSPGIEDFILKKERVEFDFLLSDKIKNEGVESFIEYWFNIPLFESLKKHPYFGDEKKLRNQNSATGLANILSCFSTGLMPSFWEKLSQFKFPVLLLNGESDEKYSDINNKMKDKLPNATHKSIPECGHNVHLEKPELFTKFVLEFLNSL